MSHGLRYYIRATVATLAIFACFSAYSQELTKWQNSDYIFKAFKEIALKNEYVKTKARILKWQQPVHYHFQYHGLTHNKMIEGLFNEQFKHLSAITSHPIEQSTSQPNLIVHLTKDETYGSVIRRFTHSKVSKLSQESHCMGSFSVTPKGEIYNAQIVIPTDHVFSRGLLVSCVIEETTQVMGLPNDSDWVHPSIANDKSKIEFLTGLDYIMLKLLYAPNIVAGMSNSSLDNELKKVIASLEKRGEIKASVKQVNQAGLYPLTN